MSRTRLKAQSQPLRAMRSVSSASGRFADIANPRFHVQPNAIRAQENKESDMKIKSRVKVDASVRGNDSKAGAGGMKVKSRIKAGDGDADLVMFNHNKAGVGGMKVKSRIKAGDADVIMLNHNKAGLGGMKVKSRIKAGDGDWITYNHNKAGLGGMKVKSRIKAGDGDADLIMFNHNKAVSE